MADESPLLMVQARQLAELTIDNNKLRAQLATVTRERDEAAAREAVMRIAFETVTEKDGVICSTHARLNLEGAIIDLERLKTANRVIIGTMKRVAGQLGQIESALATPSQRAEKLMQVMEAAIEYVHDTRDATFDALEDHVRAYQEGSSG